MKYKVRAVIRYHVPITTVLASSGEEACREVEERFRQEIGKIARQHNGGVYSIDAISCRDYYDTADTDARWWRKQYNELFANFIGIWQR